MSLPEEFCYPEDGPTAVEAPIRKACRSISPDGDPCPKERGHSSTKHGPRAREWRDGVNKPATWVPAPPPPAARKTPLVEGQCPSVSPDGTGCSKPERHKKAVHTADGTQWTGGIRSAASWVRRDDGHMSEADYQIRYLYGV